LRRIDAGGADFSQTLGDFLRYSFLKSSEKLMGTRQVSEIRIAATPCYPRDCVTKLAKRRKVLRPEIIDRGQRYQSLEFRRTLNCAAENVLAILVNRLSLSLYLATVLVEQTPNLKILTFNHPLDMLRVRTRIRVARVGFDN
jgi:hypothetical protein